MDIRVTMLDGKPHTVRVHPGDTVGSLKTLIHEKLGVPPQAQKLIFVNGNRITLSDHRQPVSYYGLQPGSQVSLLVTEPATFQVFIKNLQGKLTTYDIKPGETVSNLKSRIQSREGLPVSQQRLTYQSRDLQEGKLSDYNVEAMSTIELSSRLRGG